MRSCVHARANNKVAVGQCATRTARASAYAATIRTTQSERMDTYTCACSNGTPQGVHSLIWSVVRRRQWARFAVRGWASGFARSRETPSTAVKASPNTPKTRTAIEFTFAHAVLRSPSRTDNETIAKVRADVKRVVWSIHLQHARCNVA